MKTLHLDDLSQSEHFIWLSARLLERTRFERLFRGGAREPVLDALRGYQNPDGGFGRAIEPDFRGPISQPLGVEFALRVLEELEHPDPAILEGVLRYLVKTAAADGGVPNVVPGTDQYPRAPWWREVEGSPGSLLPTASIAGVLFELGVQHPWLERASGFCWSALEQLGSRVKSASGRFQRIEAAYQARAALTFLDHTPERAKAERAAEELGRVLRAAELIASGGEAMQPLDYAPRPNALARRWFDDAAIERELDRSVEARAADGGWSVPWEIWTPAVEHEWRGVLTLECCKTLRAYGRLEAP